MSTDTDTVVQLLGTDPWMRFDLWSQRAWEAAQNAITVAEKNGPPVNADDNLDPRIITSFHAAGVAKDFADMVNPIDAVQCSKGPSGLSAVPTELALEMLLDDD